jgi:hypothetical protein
MWPLRINPYAVRAVSIPSKSSSVGEDSSSRTRQSEAHTQRVGEAVADRVGDRLVSSFASRLGVGRYGESVPLLLITPHPPRHRDMERVRGGLPRMPKGFPTTTLVRPTYGHLSQAIARRPARPYLVTSRRHAVVPA